MSTLKSKFNVGSVLVLSFVITLATGIILHLGKHGVMAEFRAVIRVLHWVAGLAMVASAVWHGLQFRKMFVAMRRKFVWFWGSTWIVVVFTFLTFLSGMLKLLSPVKIHHLGLWHYGFGIVMSVAVAVHLCKGVPSWFRMRKMLRSR